MIFNPNWCSLSGQMHLFHFYSSTNKNEDKPLQPKKIKIWITQLGGINKIKGPEKHFPDRLHWLYKQSQLVHCNTWPIHPANSSGLATVAERHISWTSFGQYITLRNRKRGVNIGNWYSEAADELRCKELAHSEDTYYFFPNCTPRYVT